MARKLKKSSKPPSLWLSPILFWVPAAVVMLLVIGQGGCGGGKPQLSLKAATEAAYARATRVDLDLAGREAAGGRAAAAEARLSRAQDRLASPQLHSTAAGFEKSQAKDFEARHAAEINPIRRKRGMDRFGREGAETR